MISIFNKAIYVQELGYSQQVKCFENNTRLNVIKTLENNTRLNVIKRDLRWSLWLMLDFVN